MYVVVRKDLSFPQQAVQGAHAAIEAARTYLAHADDHPHLVMLVVKDEKRLLRLEDELKSEGIQFTSFIEPDIGHKLTAIASAPLNGDERKHFAKFQMMRESYG